MKNIKFLSILFILINFNIAMTHGNSETNIYKKIDLFSEVLSKVDSQYVEEINQSDVMDAAINGVLQSLDPYSAYLTPDMYKNMTTDTKGEFGGVGIEVGMEAGVVKVRRLGVKKALKFRITREIIEVASVKSELKKKNIGYIRLTSFNQNSSEQIKKEIKNFKKNDEIKKFILDLRNNPGGLLSQAIKISDYFLDNGEIVSTKSRNNSENRKWFAKKGDILDGFTILVLINYGSASASEILAGALKDHKRAIIIGERSYGKGSVQSIIPLDNSGAIRLTVSKYYLPSGESISDVGVEPDFEVKEEGDEFRINTDTDNQLKFALKLLNG